MTKKTISGTVTNSAGGIAPFSGEIDIVDSPTIVSVTVTPNPAPAGTQRVIKIVATDPAGLPLTYSCSVDGVPATPGFAPGEFIWQG